MARSILQQNFWGEFNYAHSAAHFDLNFVKLLFLTAIVLSQRILSFSIKRNISRQGEMLFNQHFENMMLGRTMV